MQTEDRTMVSRIGTPFEVILSGNPADGTSDA